MNDFTMNIYRPGNEKYPCPCLAAREVREFTYNLLRRTRPNLSKQDMKDVAKNLIEEAQIEVQREKAQKAAIKKRQQLRRPPRPRPKYSATSSSSTSSASTSSHFRTDQESSSDQSGSESQDADDMDVTIKRIKKLQIGKERQSRSRNRSSSPSAAGDFLPLMESTPTTPGDTSKRKSAIPILKRRFSSVNETSPSAQLQTFDLAKPKNYSFYSKLPVMEKRKVLKPKVYKEALRLSLNNSARTEERLQEIHDGLQEILAGVNSALKNSK